MTVVAMKRKKEDQPHAYTVRVVHPEMKGIRISLGQFKTFEKATRALARFKDTGDIPANVKISFKNVWSVGSQWYLRYEDVEYGPYASMLEAAWNRRRMKDNDTQRQRRAEVSNGKKPRAAKANLPPKEGSRRSERSRSEPVRYSPPPVRKRRICRRSDTPEASCEETASEDVAPVETPQEALPALLKACETWRDDPIFFGMNDCCMV